jgi:hypothetical protein
LAYLLGMMACRVKPGQGRRRRIKAIPVVFESHHTHVIAGLVPATLRTGAQRKTKRGGWDKPGHDSLVNASMHPIPAGTALSTTHRPVAGLAGILLPRHSARHFVGIAICHRLPSEIGHPFCKMCHDYQ